MHPELMAHPLAHAYVLPARLGNVPPTATGSPALEAVTVLVLFIITKRSVPRPAICEAIQTHCLQSAIFITPCASTTSTITTLQLALLLPSLLLLLWPSVLLPLPAGLPRSPLPTWRHLA